MRGYMAAGFLLVAGLVLMGVGFAGRFGVLVAAVIAPESLILPDDPSVQGS